jgi:hypothetical protein
MMIKCDTKIEYFDRKKSYVTRRIVRDGVCLHYRRQGLAGATFDQNVMEYRIYAQTTNMVTPIDCFISRNVSVSLILDTLTRPNILSGNTIL